MSWFRPSGGLLYHWRALWRRRLWRPFVHDIEHWLREWNPPRERDLLLIGPSGGYTLPSSWLGEFTTVRAFDVDPLAPIFFGLQHSTIDFNLKDAFFTGEKLSLAPLREILKAHPHASILFCNCLGQLPLEKRVDETEWLEFLRELRADLTGRVWASYHDVYSIEPLPTSTHAEVHSAFRASDDITESLPTHSRFDVIDHVLTGAWSKGLPTRTFAWSLSPNILHLIQGVQSLPTPSPSPARENSADRNPL